MIVFQVLIITLQLGISAVNADCPKLRPMQWTNPRDSSCITDPSPVNKACGFSCPSGYALEDDHDRVYFQLVCQPNGTWSGVIHKCVDEEPPSCSFCPNDFVKVYHSAYERVNWDRPICSDNSHLPPQISCNYQSGQIFRVPGKYKVEYTVEDFAFPKQNIYRGCSFTITLKMAKCPMYDPPKNGALVCLIRDADGSPSFCQVACKIGTDFNFNPPWLYVCPHSGQWVSTSNWPVQRLPWPNCSSGAGPSMQKRLGRNEYFYNGDQTSSEMVSELKRNFINLVKGPYVPPHYCLRNICRLEKVQVYMN